jgi:hypothetical protein
VQTPDEFFCILRYRAAAILTRFDAEAGDSQLLGRFPAGFILKLEAHFL